MKNLPPAESQLPNDRSLLKSIEQMAVSAGVSPAGFVSAFQSDLKRCPDPRRALNNVHRFLSSGFSASLLRDFQQHRQLQQIALDLFSQSQYLADILVRDPELFRWLTATSALNVTKTASGYLREARQAVVPLGRMEKKLDALKRLQRRELLRVGTREILGEADVSVTASELSALAEAIVSVLVELAEEQLLKDSRKQFASTLAVIGLGKLGGNELNFSSDIDLMFVYDQDGECELPSLRAKTFHEYYSRVAELVVRRLTEQTGEGHFYRVDLRLRPEGTVGPIALSRAASLNYYETRGELWERQMLTKARTIAGNVAVGEKLLNDLKPFVYPRSRSGSPLKAIAEMKRKIEARTDAEANIKLGSGGIRDIEFIVQALQLLYGGALEKVRERNTLGAIDRLEAISLLKRGERKHLASAYIFFRIVEHRLQLLYGMQTHSLPSSKAEMALLAARLRFRSVSAFTKGLDSHRRAVKLIFASVFAQKKSGKLVQTTTVRESSLRGYGFLNRRVAADQIMKIAGSLPGLLDGSNLRRFLRSLATHKAPDWGLQNFALLVNTPSLQRPLDHALMNEKLIGLLLLVCSRSRRMTELLAGEPLLFETLVGKPDDVLSPQAGWEYFQKHDLRRYKVFNEFKILLRWLTEKVSIVEVVAELSKLADEIVGQQYHKVLRELDIHLPMILVTLGKYGGNEITLQSDLDLFFIYRKQNDSNPARAEDVVRMFAAAFVHEGTPVYDIDMRLRPEGKNAPLAVEVSYYREYLRERASLWERQSLLKARIVAGDEELAQEVRSIIDAQKFSGDWVNEMAKMRRSIERERSGRARNLKVGKGGLVDIEFLVQALQMKFGDEREGLSSVNTHEALEVSGRTKLLSSSTVKTLEKNLLYLRALETLIKINGEQADFVLPREAERLAVLAAGMGEKSVATMRRRLRTIQQQNRKFMLQAFRICQP